MAHPLEVLLLLGFPYCDGEDDKRKTQFDETRKALCFNHIFSYLDWNDLLRLRRVCKASNILVNYHIRSGAALNISPWITIYDSSETNKPTLSSFLELGFPLAKIYLMNTSGKATFTNSVTKKFVHRFGKNIHHLRVYKFSNVPSAKEQKFYQGLVNLQSLTIDKIEGVSKSFNMLGEGKSIMQTYTFEDLLPVNKNLPGIFKQLKQLIIHASPNTLYINLALVSREITQFCEKLENAGDAFGSFVKFGIGGRTDKKLVCQIMNNIERQVLNRQSCLKSYDFQGFYEAGLSPKSQEKINSFVHAPFFLQLAKTCGKKSVNLKNINVWWLAPLDDSRRSHEREIILAPLVSMVHMHGAAYTLDLVNLEKLVIPATSQSCLYPVKQMKVGIWPKLAVLEITVDSFLLDGLVLAYDANTQSAGCMPQAPTSDLMRFLLVDIARPVLKELTLRYVKGVECDVITVNLVARLGKCCPNLQKLVLVNWPGNNSILQEGLTGLNKLEELSLERCKLVGNDAFKNVGLKGLKKLSLKDLNQMPGITDELFESVLQKLNLLELKLSSSKPLKKVTANGIRALLKEKGKFCKSIAKFPFRDWSLAGMKNEDFEKLGNEFRSAKML